MKEQHPKFEASPTEQRPEVRYRQINALKEPIENILEQMRERIDRGDYSMIIGDDASGRIPALIFREVINTLNERKGLPQVKTLFLAGSKTIDLLPSAKDKKIKKMTKYLKNVADNTKRQPWEESRALIVTEVVVSGRSLHPLTEALRDSCIDFDIATIGLTSARDEAEAEDIKKALEKELGGKIFFGSAHIPDIYNRPFLSGVVKDPMELFSEPARAWDLDVSKEESAQKQRSLNQARADVKVVADQIVSWYAKEQAS